MMFEESFYDSCDLFLFDGTANIYSQGILMRLKHLKC